MRASQQVVFFFVFVCFVCELNKMLSLCCFFSLVSLLVSASASVCCSTQQNSMLHGCCCCCLSDSMDSSRDESN